MRQGYRPSEAQKKYERRRKHCRRKKLLKEGELKDLVVLPADRTAVVPKKSRSESSWNEGEKNWWQPTPLSTGHCAKETHGGKGTRKNRHGRYPMEKHLRRKGWRGSRKGRKDRHFVHQTIEKRPEEANNRSGIGHWEGDLVYSSFHKLYVVTLVDRKSRFLLTGITYSRKAEEVSAVICRLLKKLPKKHVRSLTLDRESDFRNTVRLQKHFLPCRFILRIPCRRGKEDQMNTLTACCGSMCQKTPVLRSRSLQNDWLSLQKS